MSASSENSSTKEESNWTKEEDIIILKFVHSN